MAKDLVMRKTVGNKRRGIRWTIKSMLEYLEFADHVALISSNSEHLQRKTEDLLQICKTGNKNKTKTMQLAPSPAVITVTMNH